MWSNKLKPLGYWRYGQGAECQINIWIRAKVGVEEEESLLCSIQRIKLAKFGNWKRRYESLVLNSSEGELPGERGRNKMEQPLNRWWT